MLQNSTTGFQVLLSTLNSGYEASLKCDKLLLGAGAAVAQQEVRSGGQGYQVVPVTHKTVCHNFCVCCVYYSVWCLGCLVPLL